MLRTVKTFPQEWSQFFHRLRYLINNIMNNLKNAEDIIKLL